MKPGILVSDICDTLFFMNTSFDFLHYCVKKKLLKRGRRRLHSFFLNRKSPAFWLLAALNKLTGTDLHRLVAVKLLSGMEKESVRGWAEEFLNSELMKNKIEPVFSEFAKRPNNVLVLASASFDVVVEPVAKMLNARFISTELESKNGKLTGRMSFDATGRKLPALIRKLHVDPNEIRLAVSDNRSDIELLKAADEAIAVCYTKDDENFWKHAISDVGILVVSRQDKSGVLQQ